jgi:hypothetical protein
MTIFVRALEINGRNYIMTKSFLLYPAIKTPLFLMFCQTISAIRSMIDAITASAVTIAAVFASL